MKIVSVESLKILQLSILKLRFFTIVKRCFKFNTFYLVRTTVKYWKYHHASPIVVFQYIYYLNIIFLSLALGYWNFHRQFSSVANILLVSCTVVSEM
jgi:hypothetical protein